jgi:hypothetical protein
MYMDSHRLDLACPCAHTHTLACVYITLACTHVRTHGQRWQRERAMQEMEYWIPALELFLVLCLGCAVYDQEVKLPQLEAECLHSNHTV